MRVAEARVTGLRERETHYLLPFTKGSQAAKRAQGSRKGEMSSLFVRRLFPSAQEEEGQARGSGRGSLKRSAAE